jgi:hypothetical protein
MKRCSTPQSLYLISTHPRKGFLSSFSKVQSPPSPLLEEKELIFYTERAFFEDSYIFLNSSFTSSTSFSILSCARFKSSGRALLAIFIARRAFCISPLAWRKLFSAFSCARCARSKVCALVSAVGGGIGIWISRGLVGDG